MPAPAALVFDLDGTLVDSRRDIAAAANAALVEHGRAPLAEAEIYPMIGDGARALVARAFSFSNHDARVDGALATFARLYASRPAVHTTLLPGARESLEAAPKRGLVTNKPRALTMLVLDALGITALLDAVWGGDDGPLKPSPAGILAVCARLGVAPARAWVVGDGPQDILAGKAAGSFTIAVPGIADRARVLAAEPDLVVDSLHEVALLVRARRA